MKKNKHIGSSIDDLMKEEGWYEEAAEQAIKEAQGDPIIYRTQVLQCPIEVMGVLKPTLDPGVRRAELLTLWGRGHHRLTAL